MVAWDRSCGHQVNDSWSMKGGTIAVDCLSTIRSALDALLELSLLACCRRSAETLISLLELRTDVVKLRAVDLRSLR